MRELTIAYVTARTDPRFEWLFESLTRQIKILDRVHLILIDFHLRNRPRKQTIPEDLLNKLTGFRWLCPKPSVWQGPFRKTAVDFFSASNARNTAIALCETTWIAFLDDCSVLLDGWLERAIQATSRQGITCGAFKKVRKLEVAAGMPTKFSPYDGGEDWRLRRKFNTTTMQCPPEWFFGCSFVAPLAWLVRANGYPEYLCDGMGYEDTLMGRMLSSYGARFYFDTSMVTWECEDCHHDQGKMLRIDPGKSPKDKSHMAQETCLAVRPFRQDFGDGITTIERLRKLMKYSDQWPIPQQPTKEWFSQMPLEEFHNYQS